MVPLLKRFSVFHTVFTIGFILDPRDTLSNLSKIRGQTLEVLLFPVIERVVVTFDTIQTAGRERPVPIARELIQIEIPIGHGGCDKVSFRIAGPQPLPSNHLADHLVIGGLAAEVVRSAR